MRVSSWFHTNSKKNKVVKIVHPGGHSELHNRPVVAADILRRNPRCCIAHPNVFQQPWAIVTPDTTLMPGQKVYVVPITTIRKLQKLSLKYHPSLALELQASQSFKVEGGDDSTVSSCWFIVRKTKVVKPDTKVGDSSNARCLTCFIKRVKTKASAEDSSKESRSSSSFESSEAEAISRKRTAGVSIKRGSPKRHASRDHHLLATNLIHVS